MAREIADKLIRYGQFSITPRQLTDFERGFALDSHLHTGLSTTSGDYRENCELDCSLIGGASGRWGYNAEIPMQVLSIPSRTIKQVVEAVRVAMMGRLSWFALIRMHWPGTPPTTKSEAADDGAVLRDAHGSMRCGNHARSWRVLSEWLSSRGDQPQDYGWLSARIFSWEDGRVISRLTEARVARLLALRRSAEVLDVVAQRLTVDPHFRPSSSADTLSLAQIAARGGAQRISRTLLSDFGARFAGDPRVSVADALKRRLTQPLPARMRA